MATRKNGKEKSPSKWYTPTNEFYSQVVDSLEDYAILTTDKNLKINSWNSGASSIFGYGEKEILGKNFDIIFTKQDVKAGIHVAETKNALKDGRATDERWHLKKDKTTFFANGLVFPLMDLEGNCIGFVKILRNITDRKKSEDAISSYLEELEELNTHKEKTLSILSHDLRSPLTSIIATSEMLNNKMDTMDPAKVKLMLSILYKSSKNMLNMLDNLVEWARIKYAAEIFTPEKINLYDSVQGVIEMLNDHAIFKKIKLLNNISKKVLVLADSKMLNSILQNIISNAIKYTQLKGEIKVTSKKEKDTQVIEVKDTGFGISKSVKDKLFTPQVDSLSAARKDDQGAGIGLLLVKGFLQKIGGEIWVESEEGQGSSFYFTLPIFREKR